MGSNPLKTVTGGVRDLNNVNEIKDQLVPNDLGKLYSATERKAPGWAVMDANLRGSEKPTKVRTSRRLPANITPQALVLVGLETQRQRRQKQENEQRERSMQEVWKDHESTALGKIVSGGRLCARCVDVTATFVTVLNGTT